MLCLARFSFCYLAILLIWIYAWILILINCITCILHLDQNLLGFDFWIFGLKLATMDQEFIPVLYGFIFSAIILNNVPANFSSFWNQLSNYKTLGLQIIAIFQATTTMNLYEQYEAILTLINQINFYHVVFFAWGILLHLTIKHYAPTSPFGIYDRIVNFLQRHKGKIFIVCYVVLSFLTLAIFCPNFRHYINKLAQNSTEL